MLWQILSSLFRCTLLVFSATRNLGLAYSRSMGTTLLLLFLMNFYLAMLFLFFLSFCFISTVFLFSCCSTPIQEILRGEGLLYFPQILLPCFTEVLFYFIFLFFKISSPTGKVEDNHESEPERKIYHSS